MFVLAPAQGSLGRILFRTLDGGCSWERVYPAKLVPSEDLPHEPQTGSIASVAIENDADIKRVYLLLRVGQRVAERAVPPQLMLAINDDDAEAWEEVMTPIRGELLGLWVAPSNAEALYVAARASGAWTDGLTSEEASQLWASDDGGRTWEPRVSNSAVEHKIVFGRMVIDPLHHNKLWAPGQNGLYRSPDGGRSWERAVSFNDTYGFENIVMDVFHEPKGPARIAAFLSRAARHKLMWSVDAGEGWSTKPRPRAFDSVGYEFPQVGGATHGSGPTDVVVAMSVSPQVFELRDEGWANITPVGLRPESYSGRRTSRRDVHYQSDSFFELSADRKSSYYFVLDANDSTNTTGPLLMRYRR